jgi:16S rRNA (cytidine1402-2'-O)-methyltransferase
MAKLYIVPTPIGNLEDISLRALRILKEVDLILVEDTRHSGRLLKHYEIETPMRAYHQHNEHKSLESLVRKLLHGESMALITDAGTPAISDPGFLLVREILKFHIEVETLPGATAFVPALVNSGLPCDRFVFEGFLPPKKGRNKRLQALQEEHRTMIFYESPYRLHKTLTQFVEYFGENRNVSISRELTKLHEENFRGSLSEASQHFKDDRVKGEIVIVLSGK